MCIRDSYITLYHFQVNPCHVLCMIHIYLLSNIHHQFIVFKAYLFRIHLFFLHGPLMAVIFPVTNTLFLPGEVATYWIEHILLLTIPIFLVKHYRYILIALYLDKTNRYKGNDQYPILYRLFLHHLISVFQQKASENS